MAQTFWRPGVGVARSGTDDSICDKGEGFVLPLPLRSAVADVWHASVRACNGRVVAAGSISHASPAGAAVGLQREEPQERVRGSCGCGDRASGGHRLEDQDAAVRRAW